MNEILKCEPPTSESPKSENSKNGNHQDGNPKNETPKGDKILFVDDDKNLLASHERKLRKKYNLETAPGGEEGLAKLASSGPFGLVIADRQMPGMDGTQFLALVKERAP